MKFNKQLAVILVLLSMLLSAVAISIYFYNQNQESIKKNSQLVIIYIAKEKIAKNTLIKEEHLKQTTIARQYIITRPLLKKEILGKYAKETIYKNEAFLKEKLSNKLEIEEDKRPDYKYNSYNMKLQMFQNPNYSLEPNDIIKVISVFPIGDEKESNEYSVQYVAKNIRVLGFMRDGYTSDKSIVKKKIKKLVKKKQVEEIIDIKADEIVLDIKQDVILTLIDNYNKGKQLWMVKSKMEEENLEEVKEEKKKLDDMVKNKPKKKYKAKKRSYPIKWYIPKVNTTTKTATISYANNEELSQTKKAKVTSSFTKECSKTDKLLMVVKNSTKLKKNPSFRAKTHKTIYKNYIIAYKDISKINNSWYVTCDGSYINSEDVIKISYDEYLKLK